MFSVYEKFKKIISDQDRKIRQQQEKIQRLKQREKEKAQRIKQRGQKKIQHLKQQERERTQRLKQREQKKREKVMERVRVKGRSGYVKRRSRLDLKRKHKNGTVKLKRRSEDKPRYWTTSSGGGQRSLEPLEQDSRTNSQGFKSLVKT